MSNQVLYNKETKISGTGVTAYFAPHYSPGVWSYPEVQTTIVTNRTPRVTPYYSILKKTSSLIPPLAYLHRQDGSSASWGTVSVFYMSSPPELMALTTGTQPQPYVNLGSEWDSIDALVGQTEALAISDLLAKIKDSKANLIQAFAEASQLQNMIGGVATKLATSYSHLRKGRLDLAARNLGLTLGKRQVNRFRRNFASSKNKDDMDQTLASGVLAIQYGVRPLLQDVIGTAELFAQKVVHQVINSATKSKTLRVNDNVSGSSSGSMGTVTRTRTRSGTISVKVGCTFATESEIKHTLAQMGVSNILLLPWELMPWSFVIDWFIPIGDFISNMDATQGLVFKNGYVSTKVDLSTTEVQVFSTAGAYSVYGRSGSSTSYSFVRSFQRRILGSFPSQSLPSFKNPVSWEHALNGISLLTAQLNGTKRLEPFRRGPG